MLKIVEYITTGEEAETADLSYPSYCIPIVYFKIILFHGILKKPFQICNVGFFLKLQVMSIY
jgi:hypothetical protein